MAQQRKNERLNFDAPVIYTVPDAKECRRARLKNYSLEGMHIEDSNRLKPDTHIFVRILKPLPRYGAVKDSPVYHAQIKWCHSKASPNLYGMGLQRVSGANCDGTAPCYHCALCGEEVPEDHLLFVDDYLCMSGECFDFFTELEGGVIKKGIEDYMNGNFL